MAVSYREINYSLRPAKAVERKMMGEGFRRLYPFQRVADYRYIGFGSIYFADFQLVHRALGLNDMISIEKNTNAKECFEFNRPYRSIDLQFGKSNDILPQTAWDKRTILWLDYDGRLDTNVLADIDTFCTRALSGSLLAVSVNAETDKEPPAEVREKLAQESGEPFELDSYRLTILKMSVGDKVPAGMKGAELRGKHAIIRTYRKILLNQIAETLTTRNAFLPAGQKVRFLQIFNFEYKDGAQMFTIGGVLVSDEEMHLFEACGFERLEFVRTGEELYEIKVPCLTQKEIRHLNSQLPSDDPLHLDAPGVAEQDLAIYAGMYRFFPAFSEILSA